MVPRGHSAHSFDPRAGATDPGAHASQNDAPRYGEAVPTAHDAQLCAFFPTEYVPTSQRAHTRTAAEGADTIAWFVGGPPNVASGSYCWNRAARSIDLPLSGTASTEADVDELVRFLRETCD